MTSWGKRKSDKQSYPKTRKKKLHRAGSVVVNMGDVKINRSRIIAKVKSSNKGFYLGKVIVFNDNTKKGRIILGAREFSSKRKAQYWSEKMAKKIRSKHKISAGTGIPVKVNSKNINMIAKKYHMKSLKSIPVQHNGGKR